MGIFKRKRKVDARKNRIVIAENTTRVGSKGYTRLKDNILYLNADGKCKVIQIESSLAHECKTTVAANLAVSLGYTEKKVIVIDLDFRRPRAHRVFGLEKEKGIAEYVLGALSEKDIVKKTEYKNVDLITRGAEIFNPSLIFVSDRFKKLMDYARENYDYVILDCAPVLQVSDYIHISKISDGVLFLVAYGITTKNVVQDAIASLRKNNVNILGTVFTMYNKKNTREYKKYYKYYNYEDSYYIDTEEDEAVTENE